jgi:hypothetical protein
MLSCSAATPSRRALELWNEIDVLQHLPQPGEAVAYQFGFQSQPRASQLRVRALHVLEACISKPSGRTGELRSTATWETRFADGYSPPRQYRSWALNLDIREEPAAVRFNLGLATDDGELQNLN